MSGHVTSGHFTMCLHVCVRCVHVLVLVQQVLNGACANVVCVLVLVLFPCRMRACARLPSSGLEKSPIRFCTRYRFGMMSTLSLSCGLSKSAPMMSTLSPIVRSE